MRPFLLLLLVLIPSSALAATATVTQIDGNRIVLNVDAPASFKVGDKVTIAAESDNSKKVELIAPRTLTKIAQTFAGKAVGIAAADFDGDNRSEVAIAFEERIEIGRIVEKSWQGLAQVTLPGAVKALTLDCADLDGDGLPELLLTAVRGETLASQVWGWSGNGYQIEAREVKWFWRVLDLPGEATVLLAQSDEGGAAPFRVVWRDGQPRAGATAENFSAPTLHGCQPLKNQGEVLWAWLDSSDDLGLYDRQKIRLWSGTEKFGGGEAFIERKGRAKGEVERRYLPSRLAADAELLVVPQNAGSRLSKNLRQAEKSRLVALRWDGNNVTEVWGTPWQHGYLADFARIGNGYLLTNTRSATDLFGKPQTTLYLWGE